MQLSNNFICLRLRPFCFPNTYLCKPRRMKPRERIAESDNRTDYNHGWRFDFSRPGAFGYVCNTAAYYLLLRNSALLDNCGWRLRRESACEQSLADVPKGLYTH